MKIALAMCVNDAKAAMTAVETFPGNCATFMASDAPSMGAGYNLCVRHGLEAGVDAFVFTHQDVRLWASRKLFDDVIALAMEEKTGFVGVAGGSGICSDGTWYGGVLYGTNELNVRRGAVYHRQDGQTYCSPFGPFGLCATLDGVLMACRADVLKKIGPWPEDMGWHFYDIWASMAAHKAGHQNYVMPLPLLHESVGEINQDWYKAREAFKLHASAQGWM
jgi:GT2 family glycosyltransferase